MAVDEFNVLQQRFELETQCRLEAEKYAAEVCGQSLVLLPPDCVSWQNNNMLGPFCGKKGGKYITEYLS